MKHGQHTSPHAVLTEDPASSSLRSLAEQLIRETRASRIDLYVDPEENVLIVCEPEDGPQTETEMAIWHRWNRLMHESPELKIAVKAFLVEEGQQGPEVAGGPATAADVV